MTRKFYHGRTETMRPCTTEALNWCKAMMDPACDVRTLALLDTTVGGGDIPGVFEKVTYFALKRFAFSGGSQEEGHAAGL